MSSVLSPRPSESRLFLYSLITLLFNVGVSGLYSQSSNPPQVTSIHSIQFTTDPGGSSPYVGQIVTVRGYTTGVFVDGFTIAEEAGPWHSIFVYTKKISPRLGDEVLVTGVVSEYGGLTEIVNLSGCDILPSTKIIQSTLVTASDAASEEYEGVLVRIASATVTGLDPSGEWTLSDVSGSLRCDDKNYYMCFPRLGDQLASVTGVLFYYNQMFKLEPRFTADIDCPAIPHYVLHGDIVTLNDRDDIMRGAYVEIRGDRVVSLASTPPPGIAVYEIDGFIFPGLVDAHNHPQWNVLDRIPFQTTFSDRYGWQGTPLYGQVQSQFQSIMNFGGANANQANLFKLAEVRALCSGTTTIQGFNCSDYQYDSFARQGIGINNAERFPGLIYSDVFPLTRSSAFWQQRSNEYWRRFAVHLAEGRTQTALQEFDAWRSLNMLDGRTMLIHGIPLRQAEFSEMARTGAHLVWSPSSNWSLYTATADIPAAIASGVNIALAPDWTESGMPDVLAELSFAAWLNGKLWSNRISPKQLVEFVTRNAARALGLEDRIGSISPGMNANLMVVPKFYQDPYLSLLSASSADIRLTVVNGRPLYGIPSLMNKFSFLEGVEDISIGGKPKRIALKVVSHAIAESDKPLSSVMNDLVAAFGASNPKICAFLSYDYATMTPATQIVIDIKPGSSQNVINTGANGVIPVAVLSTPTFDATAVAPLSVRFGPGEAVECHGKGHIEDVDGDGDLDLLLHFRTEDADIRKEDVTATLSGRTIWARRIVGTDGVKVVGSGLKKGFAEEDEVGTQPTQLPNRFALNQNYPNPFNPTTIIRYELPYDCRVTLRIYNCLGQLTSTLVDGVERAGYNAVTWDGSRYPSGIYMYRLEAVSPSDPLISFLKVGAMALVK